MSNDHETDRTVGTLSFQRRARDWVERCFGKKLADDRTDRIHRFLEEALELAQATGCTADEARELVGYVYGRPKGEEAQEMGGVVVTLNALGSALSIDVEAAAEAELARAEANIEKIRAKQKAKPKFSPLPE